jgi:hypothetical protein
MVRLTSGPSLQLLSSTEDECLYVRMSPPHSPYGSRETASRLKTIRGVLSHARRLRIPNRSCSYQVGLGLRMHLGLSLGQVGCPLHDFKIAHHRHVFMLQIGAMEDVSLQTHRAWSLLDGRRRSCRASEKRQQATARAPGQQKNPSHL